MSFLNSGTLLANYNSFNMEYRSEKHTIIFSHKVLEIFQSYIQDTDDKKEAGGILLGQIKDKTIYIIRATIPNPFDKRGRHSFERNKQIAQIIADFEFINSGGKTVYIGEWHTHPEDDPTPSGPDKSMIRDQLKLSKHIEPYLFLVIQGRKTLYVAVNDGKEIKEMEKVRDDPSNE